MTDEQIIRHKKCGQCGTDHTVRGTSGRTFPCSNCGGTVHVPPTFGNALKSVLDSDGMIPFE